MIIDKNSKTLIAEPGKVIKCICHNIVLGNKVFLDKIYKDNTLIEDIIDNYSEIEEPNI